LLSFPFGYIRRTNLKEFAVDANRQKIILEKIALAHKRRQLLGVPAHRLNAIAKAPPNQALEAVPIVEQPLPPKKDMLRNALKRPLHRLPENGTELKNSILLTGGLGDILALESHIPEDQRRTLTTIFYATSKKEYIESFFRSLPNYANLKNHIVVWDDFSRFWCFYSKEECIRKLNESRKMPPTNFIRCRDFSINKVFNPIKQGTYPFVGSSILRHKVADVERFGLPNNYITLCPYSTDKRVWERDFSLADWEESLKIIRSRNARGVVLNSGNDHVPDIPEIINLSNRTSLPEAVEVMKKATGYIGIDSSLSVLATQLFSQQNLWVKSLNGHLYSNATVYYAPHKDFGFVSRSIRL
jgi:hypothetical protein